MQIAIIYFASISTSINVTLYAYMLLYSLDYRYLCFECAMSYAKLFCSLPFCKYLASESELRL